jgi:Glu-tRNA(Gln) amidotransferase subunit E-like FAD-binding protein
MFSRIAELKASWVTNKERELQNVKLKIEQITERLNRLTDAYLEGALDRSMFEERKATLVAERRALNDRMADYQTNRVSTSDELSKFVELARSAYSVYRNAATEKKRRLLRIVMSNCIIRGKEIDIAWQIPFRQVAEREKETDGAPCCEIGRTFSPEISHLADELFAFFAGKPELDLSILD